MLISIGVPGPGLAQAVKDGETFWRPESLTSQGLEVLIEQFENPLILVRRVDGLVLLENWTFNGQIGENILFERNSQPEWAEYEGIVLDQAMLDQLSFEGINTYIEAQL